jgi:dUTP pyrophosphatase
MAAAKTLKVKILRPQARLPWRATPFATGYDLFACLEETYIELGPDVTLVPTGIALEAPSGYDIQIRPRSGLTRIGVSVPLGTVDADYRGEIFVSMHTFGTRSSYRIDNGDRIGQLVIARIADLALEEVADLAPTARDKSGHGSTGR